MSGQGGWAQMSERGTTLAFRMMLFILNHLGLRATSIVMVPIVFYFYVTRRSERHGSLQYWRRLKEYTGQRSMRPGHLRAFAHYLAFANCLLERLLLWQGRVTAFSFDSSGQEILAKHARSGRGCLLIGAHVGSVDALRFLAMGAGLRITVVLDSLNSRKLRAFLKDLNPAAIVDTVDLAEDRFAGALRLKACIERGEMVALLGDRMPSKGSAHFTRIPFLGQPAPFCHDPWTLAHLLGCPVVLFAGLRAGRRRYSCVVREYADSIVLPRREREQKVAEHLLQYSRFLEELCVAGPDQWFNFFDFWSLYVPASHHHR